MIEVQKKYGCLKVLDSGEEYAQSEKYVEYVEQYEALRAVYLQLLEERESLRNNGSDLSEEERHIRLFDLKEYLSEQSALVCAAKQKIESHYKCLCIKCGKIHFYNAETIGKEPRFCLYPIAITSFYISEGTRRKREKYRGIENVILCDKSRCLPSNEYCDAYNVYQSQKIAKSEENLQIIIAGIPRVYAKNYDADYVGMQYESLYVEECSNEHLESEPYCYYDDSNHKKWLPITVFKQYRCRCVLCGKVKYIKCSQFGIDSARGCFGYVSEAFCDCHRISSFQWIVNKLLLEHKVPYRVEYTYPDLFGIYGKKRLSFDFAILNKDGTVRCLIECQGKQHFEPVEDLGGTKQYKIQVENDKLKREYAQKHNIQLIEISYKNQKYKKIEAILKENDIIGG